MSQTADLIRAGLDRLADGDLPGYLDLCSDDVEFEFPFAPPGRPERLRGRGSLRRYLEPLLTRAAHDTVSDLMVYETDTAGTIVAEMTVGLRSLQNGLPSVGRYIAVVRAAEGRIVSCRDYWPTPRSDGAGSAGGA